MRVLVTGGAGFIGSHLSERLAERGDDVIIYTYVSDIVQGLEAGLDWAARSEPGAFEIVNLGESQTTSLSRLVELIARELGVKPELDRMPAQPGDVQQTFASIEKARTLLGYDPGTSMEEGIRRFVEWFRGQPVA